LNVDTAWDRGVVWEKKWPTAMCGLDTVDKFRARRSGGTSVVAGLPHLEGVIDGDTSLAG